MKYSKKAQSEMSPTGASAGMILAVIVLILSFSAIGYLIWGPPKLLSYLPEFANQTVHLNGSEKIRYVLTSDKVQYYDGEKWFDIAGKNIILDGKSLNGADLIKKFQDYYYNTKREEPKSIILSSKGSWAMISQYGFNPKSLGNLYINLHIEGSSAEYQYILEPSNNLVPPIKYSGGFFANIINKLSSDPRNDDKEIYSNEGKIKTESIPWRDSVFTRPILLSYSDENNQQINNKYCVKKFDNIYLIVYLDETINGETC